MNQSILRFHPHLVDSCYLFMKSCSDKIHIKMALFSSWIEMICCLKLTFLWTAIVTKCKLKWVLFFMDWNKMLFHIAFLWTAVATIHIEMAFFLHALKQYVDWFYLFMKRYSHKTHIQMALFFHGLKQHVDSFLWISLATEFTLKFSSWIHSLSFESPD